MLCVVVPDLERLIQDYTQALRALAAGEPGAEKRHQRAIAELFDQMVRRDASGVGEQRGWRRWLEHRLRGGADATGELHRWMYDRHSLGALFAKTGLREAQACSAVTSRVAHWASFQLDTNPDGSAYKPESLYLEGVKP